MKGRERKGGEERDRENKQRTRKIGEERIEREG